MKKLAEKLSNIPVMKELGDALKNGDISDIKQKVEKLNEMLEKLDTSEAEKLAEELGSCPGHIKEHPTGAGYFGAEPGFSRWQLKLCEE